jgi:hypothetical protein
LERETIILRIPRWGLVLIGLVSGGWFVFWYGGFRVWETDGGFGFTLTRGAFALLLSVLGPFMAAWPCTLLALGLPVLAIGINGLVKRRSSRRGIGAAGAQYCTGCHYPAEGLPAVVCPECGGSKFESAPPRRVLSWKPLVFAAAVGCILGVAIAEARISSDEAAFRREVAAGGCADQSRPRAWPYGGPDGMLLYRSGVFSSQGD